MAQSLNVKRMRDIQPGELRDEVPKQIRYTSNVKEWQISEIEEKLLKSQYNHRLFDPDLLADRHRSDLIQMLQK